MDPKTRSNSFSLATLITVLTILALPAVHAAVTWTGSSGSDLNWSTGGNWTGAPSGQDVRFENPGSASNSTTVTSIVDATTTINGLHFRNYADNDIDANTNYHTLQINDGVTLNVASHLRVGDQYDLDTTTWANVTGPGTLNVNAPSANIDVDYNGKYWKRHPAQLDLSGLATFTANVNQVRIGPSNPYANSSPYATLRLAETSEITANSMILGGGQHNYGYLYLNENTTLHIDTITLAKAGNSHRQAYVYFETGLSNATAIIRGSAGGDSRADLTVADSSPSGTRTHATADFSGGSVDARFDEIKVAIAGAGDIWNPSANGTLTFGPGTVDANTVMLGQAVATDSGNRGYEGFLNLNGTTFRVGTLTMGDLQDGGGINARGVSDVRSVLNLNSGTLQVGLLQGGAEAVAIPTRTFNWSAGTIQNDPGTDATITHEIPLTLLTAATHTFTVDADRTMTVDSQISGASGTGGIAKTGDGTLVLSGSSSFTGGTTVNGGTLVIANANALGTTGAIYVGAGATLAVASGTVFNELSRITLDTGSTLGGNGEYETGGSWTVPGGVTVAPGMSIGTLTMDMASGTLAFDPDAVLEIEVDENGNYDQLIVLGDVDLGGVTLNLLGEPARGQWMTIIDANSITGAFALDDPSYLTRITDTGEFQISIPEPASVLLLGLAGLVLMRRHRR